MKIKLSHKRIVGVLLIALLIVPFKLIDRCRLTPIQWDKVITNDINAIAFNKDNMQVYKYEFNPKHPDFTDLKELRWYSLKNK